MEKTASRNKINLSVSRISNYMIVEFKVVIWNAGPDDLNFTGISMSNRYEMHDPDLAYDEGFTIGCMPFMLVEKASAFKEFANRYDALLKRDEHLFEDEPEIFQYRAIRFAEALDADIAIFQSGVRGGGDCIIPNDLILANKTAHDWLQMFDSIRCGTTSEMFLTQLKSKECA